MAAARVTSAGRIYQLEKAAEPVEIITEADAADSIKLSRLLMRLAKDVTALKRRHFPRRIDFEDRDVDNTGTTKYRFEHGFKGRVRWWPVDVVGGVPALIRDEDTDQNTLVLTSTNAATLTIRIEEAG